MHPRFAVIAALLLALSAGTASARNISLVNASYGTREIADAYLRYWYTPEGQEIAARNFYRPRDAAVLKKYESSFAKVSLFTLEELFGSWAQAHKVHFAEGGTFDQIYKN